MRTMHVVLGLSLVVTASLPRDVLAAPITFDAVPTQTLIGTTVAVDDFLITHSGSFAHIRVNQGVPGDFSGNGTQRLISFNTSTIELTHASGSLFDFFGFDGGESWNRLPHSWATGIQVTGYNAVDTLVASQVFQLDLFKDPLLGMQAFSAVGFTQLARLEFRGVCGGGPCNPEFSIDNLNVSAVPEPASLTLLGLGLILGARRWRMHR